MTDPTITIAGLETRIGVLSEALRAANRWHADAVTESVSHDARRAEAVAERDALAAQLAEVRAELAKAPKVCAIHSYEHGPGPCMTCGAWPPGTRELIAACRTRIAGLEQAADERSAEVARLTARVAELEARPVLDASRLAWVLLEVPRDGRTLADIAADAMAKLGPVTLPPAQDRAEELIRSILGERNALTSGIGATLDDKLSDAWASEWINATRAALASLGAPPTSPPAARPVFAGVSVQEIADVYETAYRAYEHANGSPMYIHCRAAGIRAVLARLDATLVTPVDPEAVTAEYHDRRADLAPREFWPWRCVGDGNGRGESISAMRAALTAAGIPVTPEVRK